MLKDFDQVTRFPIHLFVYRCLFKDAAIVLLRSVKRQDGVWYNVERM
jgi:hypothetical protein